MRRDSVLVLEVEEFGGDVVFDGVVVGVALNCVGAPGDELAEQICARPNIQDTVVKRVSRLVRCCQNLSVGALGGVVDDGEAVGDGVAHCVDHGAAVELDVARFAINGVRVRNVALADPLDP
eukprot:8418788-Pyramimonas_sp.AAC.1